MEPVQSARNKTFTEGRVSLEIGRMSNPECSTGEFQIKGVGTREKPKCFQHKSGVDKVDLQKVVGPRQSVEEGGHRRPWKEGDEGTGES